MEKSNQKSAAPQRRKQALLPQITKLAQEGRSCREIAQRLRIGKSSVHQWLRELQTEDAASKPLNAVEKPLDPAEVIREAIGQEEVMYEEFMAAWRRSQTDKERRVPRTAARPTTPALGKRKRRFAAKPARATPRSLPRPWTRSERSASETPPCPTARKPGRRPLLADLSDEDLERLTLDDLNCMDNDQLYAIEVRMRDKHGPCRLPLVSNEELREMSPSQLREHEALCRAEIERLHNTPEPPPA